MFSRALNAAKCNVGKVFNCCFRYVYVLQEITAPHGEKKQTGPFFIVSLFEIVYTIIWFYYGIYNNVNIE